MEVGSFGPVIFITVTCCPLRYKHIFRFLPFQFIVMVRHGDRKGSTKHTAIISKEAQANMQVTIPAMRDVDRLINLQLTKEMGKVQGDSKFWNELKD